MSIAGVYHLISEKIVKQVSLVLYQANVHVHRKGFLTFLFAVQQVLAQVSLGREGHVTESTLCYGLLLVLVIAAHFPDVFLEVRQSSEQAATLIALERSQVIMASPDMHGDSGVMTERHATPRGVGKNNQW